VIRIKTAKEIEAMKTAGRISAEALRLGGAAVKPGVTTAQIDKVIYDYIVSQGARPNFKGLDGFPGSACISVNDVVIHGKPSHGIVLHEGDIVSIDTGAAFGGWNGDNAATFAVGRVSKTAEALMRATKEALYCGIAAAQCGKRIGDISAAVQKHVEAAGFSVVRTYVGHGVGRALHEDPEVPNYGPAGRGPRLVNGMVIAIEPMVNEKSYVVESDADGWTTRTVDGGLSAHFEHTIAITSAGPVILTQGKEAQQLV